MTRACVAGMVCLGLMSISALGCNSGSRDGKPNYGSSTAAGVGSGSNPGAGGALTAVAVHTDLIGGSNPPGMIAVFVNDATLASPILVTDSGSGFIDSGAPPQIQNDLLFFLTPLATTGTRYRIIGRRNGTRIESNIVDFGPFRLDTVNIVEPVGDYTGISNPIPAPGRTSWGNVNNAPSYLVILRDANGAFEWFATIPGANAYLWGEAFANNYISGRNPLPGGRYSLTVCALDNSGWATDSSDRPNGTTGQSRPFSFEVQ